MNHYEMEDEEIQQVWDKAELTYCRSTAGELLEILSDKFVEKVVNKYGSNKIDDDYEQENAIIKANENWVMREEMIFQVAKHLLSTGTV